MSESQSAPIFMFDNNDPEMQAAYQKARATFRYLWREVAWEQRRIVPALDLACVKAPFSDGDQSDSGIEQMWMGEIDFDGTHISGVLLNDPNGLTTIKEGDAVRLPLDAISDWMYAIQGNVYGAFTVNLLRSRMGRRERKEHDNAWGLNFGDPLHPRLTPAQEIANGMEILEHPMSEAMAASLDERLTQDPALLNAKDDRGWTFLHHQALAGNAATIKVLLEHDADINAQTDSGMTPLQLAHSLGWDKVIALLESVPQE